MAGIFTTKAIDTRRDRVAKHLNPFLNDGDAVVIHCGAPIQIPGGLDQHYHFYPHPDYYWITGERRHGGVTVFSKDHGWFDFILPISESERIWESTVEPINGQNVSEFNTWLQTKNFQREFHIGQIGLPTGVTSSAINKHSLSELQELWNQVRRKKDNEELELIKKSARTAQLAFAHIEPLLRTGLSERQIQVEYERKAFLEGAHDMPYTCIVGSGVRAATLHALPTDKIIKKEELVLIDAGSAHHDYCVDVTRTFTSKGNTQQKEIYDIVHTAQENAMNTCKPGTRWNQVHKAAALSIADGLGQLGILNDSPDGAVESGSVGLFFPHGVGHLLGLKVRDVGGDARQEATQIAGAKVRMDLQLEENFMVTVEPGLYFIEPLLNQPAMRDKYKSSVNWGKLDNWLTVGGVRLEDDLLITKNTPINFTKDIPK